MLYQLSILSLLKEIKITKILKQSNFLKRETDWNWSEY
ncbi:hypothetical protein MNB_SV-6-106 [hydrothermal vent metagenome]|uniref:Uncharacterized protein n=1 Tax=hydrothermal vent metagenome TaxID=652676 RepID=A0A1W1BVR1_9ZZZZ